jgi:hypothetical protein
MFDLSPEQVRYGLRSRLTERSRASQMESVVNRVHGWQYAKVSTGLRLTAFLNAEMTARV